MAETATRSLLGVYLGPNAAQRVINGQFKRGTGESMHAIIWYCDLRGFTALSEQHSAVKLVSVLDHYFECISATIEAAGGEILTFIGDAVLALLQRQSEDMPELTLHAGIALHLGDMLYGNVGGSSRLDFTVIGAAVNEVTRVEGLCKSSYPLLITKEFSQYIKSHELASIGMRKLKGVNNPHEIFTLKQLL